MSERQKAAYDLHKQGISWAEIGRRIGGTGQNAKFLAMRYERRMKEETLWTDAFNGRFKTIVTYHFETPERLKKAIDNGVLLPDVPFPPGTGYGVRFSKKTINHAAEVVGSKVRFEERGRCECCGQVIRSPKK